MKTYSCLTYISDWKLLEKVYAEINRMEDLNRSDTLQAIELDTETEEYFNLRDFLRDLHIDFKERRRNEWSYEELKSCWYMLMHSANYYGYPQPENQFHSICYNEKIACPVCGNGAPQIEPFRLKKVPAVSTGKRYGVMFVNWVLEPIIPTELSVILNDAGLSGMEYWPVLKVSGTSVWEEWVQLFIKNVLPPMSEETIFRKVETIEEIEDPWIREMLSTTEYMSWCDCGKLGLQPPTKVYYRQDDLQMFCDFNKTKEWVGGGRTTWQEIIISSKAYCLMREYCNNIDFMFEPIFFR